MKKILRGLTVFCIILVFLLFVKFGRSLYMPLVKKMQQKETVESIVQKTETKVWDRLKDELADSKFSTWPDSLALVAFKEEQKLEVYFRHEYSWKKLKEYSFTAMSGELGPKLKEGDRQIPEGIYEIEYLNPNSSFYLSIKLNYPNDFDRKKAKIENRTNLGDDIFIHGKDQSIGCIAIGDSAIEEVFMLVSYAQANGIKVIISPRDFRMNPEYLILKGISWRQELYASIQTELLNFPLK